MIAVRDVVGVSGLDLDVHQVARDLVKWALAFAGAKQAERIIRMTVRLGPHPRLTPEDLELAVRLLTRWTIAEGAEVEVRRANDPGVAVEQVVFA